MSLYACILTWPMKKISMLNFICVYKHVVIYKDKCVCIGVEFTRFDLIPASEFYIYKTYVKTGQNQNVSRFIMNSSRCMSMNCVTLLYINVFQSRLSALNTIRNDALKRVVD